MAIRDFIAGNPQEAVRRPTGRQLARYPRRCRHLRASSDGHPLGGFSNEASRSQNGEARHRSQELQGKRYQGKHSQRCVSLSTDDLSSVVLGFAIDRVVKLCFHRIFLSFPWKFLTSCSSLSGRFSRIQLLSLGRGRKVELETGALKIGNR